MKKLFTLTFFSYLLLFFQPLLGQNLVINEILTSNIASNTDEDGTPQDWIELYNKGAVAINLSGYGLSDDATVLNKWLQADDKLILGKQHEYLKFI